MVFQHNCSYSFLFLSFFIYLNFVFTVILRVSGLITSKNIVCVNLVEVHFFVHYILVD